MTAFANGLSLPQRGEHPRASGLTMVIDNGMPLHAFEDAVESASTYIDTVKFGWGTALVTQKLQEKIDCLVGLGSGKRSQRQGACPGALAAQRRSLLCQRRLLRAAHGAVRWHPRRG